MCSDIYQTRADGFELGTMFECANPQEIMSPQRVASQSISVACQTLEFLIYDLSMMHLEPHRCEMDPSVCWKLIEHGSH